MIRTASFDKPIIGEFLCASFLDMMSHFCDTDIIEPCDNENGICDIFDNEWESVSDEFIFTTLDTAFDAFSYTGGTIFLKKKIVQLVKIAKSEKTIQLDLVSELILYLIGCYCDGLDWVKGRKLVTPYSHFEFDKKDELLKAISEEDEGEFDECYRKERREAFNSFGDLMEADRKEIVNVSWDLDCTFLLEDTVPEGINKLYTVLSDYDRVDYIRPWTDIGEPIPDVVIGALDIVEKRAAMYGGLEKMRIYNKQRAFEKIQENLQYNSPEESISNDEQKQGEEGDEAPDDKQKIEWYNSLQTLIDMGYDLDRNSARDMLASTNEILEMQKENK